MAEERVQRRLAAILAADVVGYSRLIRADEEGTLAALKTLREDIIDPKIAEYHGRIVKLMGDGMLAEFPSVVDAEREGGRVTTSLFPVSISRAILSASLLARTSTLPSCLGEIMATPNAASRGLEIGCGITLLFIWQVC